MRVYTVNPPKPHRAVGVRVRDDDTVATARTIDPAEGDIVPMSSPIHTTLNYTTAAHFSPAAETEGDKTSFGHSPHSSLSATAMATRWQIVS